MLYLHDVTCFIPETYNTIEQAGKLYGLSDAMIRVYQRIYGLEKIPLAKNSLLEMLNFSLELLFRRNLIDKNKIKYIIHCHTAKVVAPFGESIVRDIKKFLQLKNAMAFGMSANNCASPIVALNLLAHILRDDELAIVLCGDLAFTSVLQVIPNTSLLGDAASAALVGLNAGKNKLLTIATKTIGRFASGLWLNVELARDFEQAYPKILSATILQAIQSIKLNLSQVKLIVPHNINLPSWQRVAKNLDIPLNKIFLKNVRKYAHCFGSDIFINQISAELEGCLIPGDHWLMATVGLGATFAVAVFQKT